MLVQINVDVYAYYEQACPVYRIWVNDTLYNEREHWVDWKYNYIEEELHVELEPGEHSLTIEKVISGATNKIWVERVIIKYPNNTNISEFPPAPQDKQIIKFKIQ